MNYIDYNLYDFDWCFSLVSVWYYYNVDIYFPIDKQLHNFTSPYLYSNFAFMF